jgi:glycosyltransferase involved in cell wall biosynthesis
MARISTVLPWRAMRDRLDVLLVQYTGPPVAPCPVVTVVHDVAFALFPASFSRTERLWMPRTIPWTMRRAARVITVSEFSRSEIERVYGLSADRVSVAPDGVDPAFLSPPGRPAVDPPFLMAVGNVQPRKGLGTLVEAYRELVRRRPDIPERLVIVGQPWHASEAASLALSTADLRRDGRLVFTGYVDDPSLAALYASATALAFPSTYEGFGLPPVEAMAAGTPAVVSDIPVMREVAGDAALRVPPGDPTAWARALLEVTTDAKLRNDLIRRGRERAASFTWDRTAEAVIEALECGAGARTSPSGAGG